MIRGGGLTADISVAASSPASANWPAAAAIVYHWVIQNHPAAFEAERMLE
jgi:hypothetical protein